MLHYIFMYWQRGKGVQASVSTEDENEGQTLAVETIRGILFFRRNGGREITEVATTSNSKDIVEKGFYIEQAKPIGRHRKLTAGKDEKAFFLTGENGPRLCLDADVMDLRGPTYSKKGHMSTADSFSFEDADICICKEYVCPSLDITVEANKWCYAWDVLDLKDQYRHIVSGDLLKATSEQDIRSAITKIENIMQEVTQLRKAWQNLNVEDFEARDKAIADVLALDEDNRRSFLERLREECHRYLFNDKYKRQATALWTGNEWVQIAVMFAAWDSLTYKPFCLPKKEDIVEIQKKFGLSYLQLDK